MGLFKKNKGVIADVIRCDETDYLIWKWHPANAISNVTTRENAIRWGSSLRVKDGSVAVFVYKQDNNIFQDFIEGPYDGILETKNLPVISNIIGLGYAGQSPFQAEVYFINIAKIIQSKFAVPFFDVYDSRFPDFGVPVAVRGTVTYKINDFKTFVKLHRLDHFSTSDFNAQVRDAVARYAKEIVTNIPATQNVPVIQLETSISVVNDTLESKIIERFANDFGVCVSGVDVSAIEVDRSSDGYRHLMSVTRDVTSAKVQAETMDYLERLRIQREEGQYSLHKQTQSVNIGAFQVEKQAEVGIAGANALGQMGANGAGSIDLNGNGGIGLNPATMMAGMAVGGAVGQNIAATMNNVLSGMNQPIQKNTVPPPIPVASYYVATNGQAAGPFEKNVLASMAANGQFTVDCLVWKDGLSQWEKAGNIAELKSMFSVIPPVPPQV